MFLMKKIIQYILILFFSPPIPPTSFPLLIFTNYISDKGLLSKINKS